MPRVFYTVMALLAWMGLAVAAQANPAPDYVREKRWAEEILPGILLGEPIYLTQKNGHRFLGIYTQAKPAKTALVIAHGMGLHPDWGMIGMLRQQLAEQGYSTLSIQMPLYAAEVGFEAYPALFPEAAQRLKLAVAYLKAKGYARVVLVSHSNGSRMSRVYMAGQPAEVSAWVALSLTQGDTFKGVNVPVLDLYGQYDLPHVVTSVTKRKATLAHRASQQVVLPQADHFYNGHEELMIQTVKTFLDKLK